LPKGSQREQKLPNTQDPTRPRILLADDHPLYRDALRQLLNGCSGFDVVGDAADGLDALELCRRLRPELVLMDLGMPRMDGLKATRAIKKAFPRTIILVLTASGDVESLSEALKAGAAGYILKDAPSTQIVESIRRVLRGESPLNQELAMQLLLRKMDEGLKEEEGRESTIASSPYRTPEKPCEARSDVLTPREIEVLRLIVQGKTNREIAQILCVALTTVKHHVHRIITKLEVSDRTQAAVQAVAFGIISTE
jgi:DNA-binding NarL/FixJ family response regulator